MPRNNNKRKFSPKGKAGEYTRPATGETLSETDVARLQTFSTRPGVVKPNLNVQTRQGGSYGRDAFETSDIPLPPPRTPMEVFTEGTLASLTQGFQDNMTGVSGIRRNQVTIPLAYRALDAPKWVVPDGNNETEAKQMLRQATTVRGDYIKAQGLGFYMGGHPNLTMMVFSWREAIENAFKRQFDRPMSDEWTHTELELALVTALGAAHIHMSMLGLRAIAAHSPDTGVFAALKSAFSSTSLDKQIASNNNMLAAWRIPLGYGVALSAVMAPQLLRKPDFRGRNAEYRMFGDLRFPINGTDYQALVAAADGVNKDLTRLGRLASIISGMEYLPHSAWLPDQPKVGLAGYNPTNPTDYFHANAGVWVPAIVTYDGIEPIIQPMSYGHNQEWSFAFTEGKITPSWHMLLARHEWYQADQAAWIHYPGLFPLAGYKSLNDTERNDLVLNTSVAAAADFPWHVFTLDYDLKMLPLTHRNTNVTTGGISWTKPALHRVASQIGVQQIAENFLYYTATNGHIEHASGDSWNEFHDDQGTETEIWFPAGASGDPNAPGGLNYRMNRAALELTGLSNLRYTEPNL